MANDVSIKILLEGIAEAKRQLEELAGSMQKLDPAASNAAAQATALKNALAGAQSAAKAANDDFNSLVTAGDATNDAFGGLIEKAKSVATILGVGVVAAAGWAAKQLYSTTQELVATGEQMHRLSQQTGVSVETMSAFSLVAATSSTTTEQMARGMEFLARKVADAQREGKEAKSVFGQLGISIKDDVSGRVKDLDQLFLEISDKISGYSDGSNKAALMTEFFGRALGNSLIPVMNLGSAEIRKLMEEAQLAGRVMSGDAAKAADEYANNMRVLNAYSGQLWRDLAGPGVAALAEITRSMRDARREGAGFFGMLAEGWTTFWRLTLFGSEAGQLGKLKERSAFLGKEIAGLYAKRPSDESWDIFGTRSAIDAEIKQREKELARIAPEITRLEAFLSPTGAPGIKPEAPVVEKGKGAKTGTQNLRDELADAREEVRKYDQFLVDSGRMGLDEYKATLEAQLEAIKQEKGQAAEIAERTGKKEADVLRRLANEDIAVRQAIRRIDDKERANSLAQFDMEAKKDEEALQRKVSFIDAELAKKGHTEEEERKLLQERDKTYDQIFKNQIARQAQVENLEITMGQSAERSLKKRQEGYAEDMELYIKSIQQAQGMTLEEKRKALTDAYNLMKGTGGALEEGAKAAEKLAKAINDLPTDDLTAALGQINALTSVVGSTVQTYNSLAGAIASNIAGVLKGDKSMPQAMIDVWTAAKNSIIDQVGKMFADAMLTPWKTAIAGALNEMFTAAKGVFDMVFKGFYDLMKPILEPLFTWIGNTFKGIFKKKTGDSLLGMDDMTTVAEEMFGPVESELDGVIGKAETGIGGVLSSLGSGIVSIFGSIGSLFTSLFSGLGKFIDSIFGTSLSGSAAGGAASAAAGGGGFLGWVSSVFSGSGAADAAAIAAATAAADIGTTGLTAEALAEMAAALEAASATAVTGTAAAAGGTAAGGTAAAAFGGPLTIAAAVLAYALLGGGGDKLKLTDADIALVRSQQAAHKGAFFAANPWAGEDEFGLFNSEAVVRETDQGVVGISLRSLLGDSAKFESIEDMNTKLAALASGSSPGRADWPTNIYGYAMGGEFLVSRPTVFTAGEMGPEKVRVSPLAGGSGFGGGRGGLVMNFNGPFVADSYAMKLFLKGQERLLARGGFA